MAAPAVAALLASIVLGAGAVAAGTAVAIRVLGLTERARLAKLQPHIRRRVQLIRRVLARDYGIQTYVGSTWRSLRKQKKLVGKVSATVKSWHRLGLALELYIIDPLTGKPDKRGRKRNRKLWNAKQDVAEEHGGKVFRRPILVRRADGTIRKVQDLAHIEFREDMSWRQAFRDAKRKGIAVA